MFRYEAEFEDVIPGPVRLVWAFAVDSNRWDRLLGAAASTYGYREEEGGSRIRVGRAVLFWGAAEWTERGEYVEGRFGRGERHFIGGPIAVAGVAFETSEDPGGTRVIARSWIESRVELPEEMAAGVTANARTTLEVFYAEIGSLTEGVTEDDGRGSPITRAHRILAVASVGRAYDGPFSPVRVDELNSALARVGPVVETVLKDRFVELLERRSDSEVAQLRPFELARVWKRGRREVLRGFLHAAHAGIFDLRWQTICPSCRVPAGLHARLEDVQSGFCPECDADYTLDFAENIEAVFSANRSVRPVREEVWCAASAWRRPHVFARLELSEGEERVLHWLPGEPIRVRVGPHELRLSPDRGPFVVRVTDQGLALGVGGTVGLTLQASKPVMVQVERATITPDLARAADIVTVPEFHGLFAMEAPATGMQLSVSNTTIWFCDLFGSTALYTRLGDGRAFALIQSLFAELEAVITRHEGAALKTMGDAVMAVFPTFSQGLAAAIEAVEEVQVLDGHDLSLRCGVHTGPCLAVRANGRLDFFGTTVNLAARLEAAAEANEVLIAEEMLDRPGTTELVAARATSRRIEHPKGLAPLVVTVIQGLRKAAG